jgi:sugar lactone lactonase YvrE
MNDIELQVLWQAKARLGEGPLWVAREQCVYWLDILTCRVFRYQVHTGNQTTWQWNQAITSLAARSSGGFLGTALDGLNDDQLQQQPLAGSLLCCKPGVEGLPTPLFKG